MRSNQAAMPLIKTVVSVSFGMREANEIEPRVCVCGWEWGEMFYCECLFCDEINLNSLKLNTSGDSSHVIDVKFLHVFV